VGGRTCLLDHFHDGSGSGPTRAAAMRAPIGAWSDFTAFEYGGRWGSYGLAVSKRGGCSGGPGNVSCNASARPCLRLAGHRHQEVTLSGEGWRKRCPPSIYHHSWAVQRLLSEVSNELSSRINNRSLMVKSVSVRDVPPGTVARTVR
jgi:hypothetical protein